MIISMRKEECIRLTDHSVYNHTVYRMPVDVNGCRYLLESYDGGENFNSHEVGDMVDGKFVPKFWLHTDDDDECFVFDSDTIKDHNEWT